ncbi:hypothetical protein Y026_5637 [Burkholderia pseudomallei TSV28]|nr:hypothetical protein Y026_5637 [Burkholderia pseudomallei TSV28]
MDHRPDDSDQRRLYDEVSAAGGGRGDRGGGVRRARRELR